MSYVCSWTKKKEEKACKTMAQKSKFGRLFTRIYINNTKLKNNGQELNFYFLPEVVKALTTYYMPLTPLFTGIMIYEENKPTTRFAIT